MADVEEQRHSPENEAARRGTHGLRRWASARRGRSAHKKLAAIGDPYRAMFECSPEAIVLVDGRGTVLDTNRRVEEWLGYSPEEMVGRNVLQLPFMVPSARVTILRKFVDRMMGKEVPVYDVTFQTKSGEDRIGRIRGAALRDETGRIVADLVLVSDVTEIIRTEETLENQRKKIEGLHGTAAQLEFCESRDHVCATTVTAARKLLGFPLCLVYSAGDAGLVLESGHCAPPRDFRVESVHPSPMVEECYRTRKTITFADCPDCVVSLNGKYPRSGICVSLEESGVFEALSFEPMAFSEEDARLLELLTGHARAAFHNIALRCELHEQAIRDQLTGLYNRRQFEEAVARELERARRYRHPIGFLMADVDRFKNLNDTCGHAEGDAVLRAVARFLLGQVRSTETVYRYGGDEFLVMMPESGASAEAVLSRVRNELAEWNADAGRTEDPIQLSLGYASWDPAHPKPVHEIIAEADTRMFEDKREHAGCSREGGAS